MTSVYVYFFMYLTGTIYSSLVVPSSTRVSYISSFSSIVSGQEQRITSYVAVPFIKQNSHFQETIKATLNIEP